MVKMWTVICGATKAVFQSPVSNRMLCGILADKLGICKDSEPSFEVGKCHVDNLGEESMPYHNDNGFLLQESSILDTRFSNAKTKVLM
jgi:hypothetical protein